MKRGKKNINININFSNRWLYSLITLAIIVLISIGIYAVAPNPGHSWSEVGDLPSDFVDGDISWNELSGIPAGFADGVDDSGGGAPITSGGGRLIANRWDANTPTQDAMFDHYAPYVPNVGDEIIANGFVISNNGASRHVLSVRRASSSRISFETIAGAFWIVDDGDTRVLVNSLRIVI